MPELPEVETVVRTLRPQVLGRVIVEARVLAPLILKGKPEPQLNGMRIVDVTRHGKTILIWLDQGVLSIHLGMTGKLLVNAAQGTHTRAWFTLDQGLLIYDDIRMFGRVEFSTQLPPHLAALGPDPLLVSPQEFAARLAGRKTRIKPLLLNQKFLRGLGNIYADESLFRAGIHPETLACKLKPLQVRKLHLAIVEILRASIDAGGSSISDYVDSDGRKGSFQQQHRVYAMQGKPCTLCGSLITRIVVAQRGTHYCKRCQKR